MTKLQSKVLDFLKAWFNTHQHAPSFDQIALGVGIKSKSGVHRVLEILEQEGYITRSHQRARSITLTSKANNTLPDIIVAATNVLDSITSEDLENGTVVVSGDAIAQLDLLLSGYRKSTTTKTSSLATQ